MYHPLSLLISLNELDILLDSVDSSPCFADRDDSRFLEVLLGQTFDWRGHSGREESSNSISSLLYHRLPVDVHLFSLVLAFHSFAWQLVQNEGEIGFETKVDHSVCLVHDDIPTLRKDDHMSFNDVLQ